MKILLLTVPYSVEERYGKAMKKLIGPNLYPPLGILYIAAVLENQDHEVTVLDTNILEMGVGDIREYLQEHKFDMIGISLYTPMYENFKKLISSIKPVIGDTPVVVGGPHTFLFPKETIETIPEIDYSVHGEGEAIFPEIADYIEGKTKLSNIKGICYRENGNIIMTEMPPFTEDLDTIPYPARHLVPMEKYIPSPSTYKNLPAHHMIATRGCYFRCTYCASAEMLKRTIRYHSVKRVVDEMEHLIETYKSKEVFFLDDLFVANRKFVLDFCDEVINRGLNKKFEWSCHSRSGLVTKEMLLKMKESGCWQLHFGVESGVQRLLDMVKKGITPEMSKESIRLCREVGITTRAYLMLGLPTETREESLQTIQFAKEMDPDYVKFSLLTPYPGTPIFEQIKKEGNIATTNWEYYKTVGGFGGTQRPYVPQGRTSEELNELHKRAFKEFYFRPKIIARFLTIPKTMPELKMYIKSGIALLKA